jgi:hypothetical protein
MAVETNYEMRDEHRTHVDQSDVPNLKLMAPSEAADEREVTVGQNRPHAASSKGQPNLPSCSEVLQQHGTTSSHE